MSSFEIDLFETQDKVNVADGPWVLVTAGNEVLVAHPDGKLVEHATGRELEMDGATPSGSPEVEQGVIEVGKRIGYLGGVTAEIALIAGKLHQKEGESE